MYDEDDYLELSGIQHFAFCRRQWALIHIEHAWSENLFTAEGRLMHERVHDNYASEKRRDIIITRDMPIHSRTLGATGKCDVVEFSKDDISGVSLTGRAGLWSPLIIEYKRGKVKADDCDRLQLAAQAICLEEMLGCRKMDYSCLYYGETKRRENVDLNEDLRNTVKSSFSEMHEYYNRGYTLRAKITKKCKQCSLVDQCLPALNKNRNVAQYISDSLAEADK